MGQRRLSVRQPKETASSAAALALARPNGRLADINLDCLALPAKHHTPSKPWPRLTSTHEAV